MDDSDADSIVFGACCRDAASSPFSPEDVAAVAESVCSSPVPAAAVADAANNDDADDEDDEEEADTADAYVTDVAVDVAAAVSGDAGADAAVSRGQMSVGSFEEAGARADLAVVAVADDDGATADDEGGCCAEVSAVNDDVVSGFLTGS